MMNILFLAHRLPYPPSKGDKIRSYHLLKWLVDRHRVFLGSFVDDPLDQQYEAKLESLCARCCFVHINPIQRKLLSASGLLFGEALTFAFYRNRRLRDWVSRLGEEVAIDAVFVFSACMAPTADALEPPPRLKILDLCDLDSAKWAQYAGTETWPMNAIYRREARLLEAAENDLATRYDSTLLVSADEARELEQRLSNEDHNVQVLANGVDSDYFDPAVCYPRPFPSDGRVVVFVGAMDYRPNIDAVSHYAREMHPLVRDAIPSTEFWIVGSKPAQEVVALASLGGIQVTGTVDDVRPYLSHADVVVAPMRMGRGIQNKVLEAMSMARPTVASGRAVRGFGAEQVPGVMVADHAKDFARRVIDLLSDDLAASRSGHAAREFVLSRFSWDAALAGLAELLGPEIAAKPRARLAEAR